MFELSVALKYLIPRRRQLSVSIIALVSVLVISLVVWLVVVFLSVTEGIERRWLGNLVALNAPLKLTPTEAYYHSYYHQIDEQSLASDFLPKTIAEKRNAAVSDPYDPEMDGELPAAFPVANRDQQGNLRDPVKGAFEAAEKIPGAMARDFEMGLGNLRLRLLRKSEGHYVQSFMNQVVYLGTFDVDNPYVARTLQPVHTEDVSHCLEFLSLSGANAREEMPSGTPQLPDGEFRARLHSFLTAVKISELESSEEGWILPSTLYPSEGTIRGYARLQGPLVREIALDGEGSPVTIHFKEDGFRVVDLSGEELLKLGHCPLRIRQKISIPVELDTASMVTAKNADDLLFQGSFDLKGVHFEGLLPYRGLTIGQMEIEGNGPWVQGADTLPEDAQMGRGILLAKSYRDADVRIGDRGYIGYYAGTPSSVQEQRLPVYVAGFYDPGLMPIGSKLVLADRTLISDVKGSVSQVEARQGTGIQIWFDDIKQVDQVKAKLEAELEARGILPYWHVETFKDYDFARPLVQQFQSDRNLFFLIAAIVILVACSNIISMLILLVNDKKREIGILASMGAKRSSIAFIFAFCGVIMGFGGSLLGVGAAILTLRNLDALVALMSRLQGHEAFQALFFGEGLPNEISYRVLGFVIAATAALSLLAGLIPAMKATRVRPSDILRSQ